MKRTFAIVGLAIVALAVAKLLAVDPSRPAFRGEPIVRSTPAPSNVVLIVVDTLRADHLGAWGYDRDTSPRLDALAAGGVRFANFYSSSSWTRPAMASLLTGEYARTVGVYEERFDVLPRDVVTLAETLAAAGYATLGVTSNPNVNAWFGFDQGFDEYVDSDVVFWLLSEAPGERRFNRRKNPLATADEVTDRALALVEAHREDLATAPLYLQVLYVDPHVPYEPPAAHLKSVSDESGRIARYDGEVHYADAEIGRLLDGLSARGLLDDALVIVTSDHGEGLEDHLALPIGGTHGHHLYDSVLHVPLILSHPALPAGRVVDELGSIIDLVPTVLEAVGAEAPDGSPGRSLWTLARGGEAGPGWRDRVYAESDWRYTDKLAVRTTEQHLVRSDGCAAFQADGSHEQQQLKPSERRMLARIKPVEQYPVGAPQEPQRSRAADPELLADLAAWEARTPRREPEQRDPEDVVVLADGTVVRTASGAAVNELDAGTAQQLRALGYLDAEVPE